MGVVTRRQNNHEATEGHLLHGWLDHAPSVVHECLMLGGRSAGIVDQDHKGWGFRQELCRRGRVGCCSAEAAFRVARSVSEATVRRRKLRSWVSFQALRSREVLPTVHHHPSDEVHIRTGALPKNSTK